MLLTEEQIDAFQVNGFARSRRVLSDAEIDALREGIRAVVEDPASKKPLLARNLLSGKNEYGETKPSQEVVHQLVNMWEVNEAFLELAKHPEITATVARLCNNAEILRIWHDQVQYKPPVTGGPTNWHQDYPAWPVLAPADLVSAWVALDDALIENGCMWMVPRSHRWGRVPLKAGANFAPVYDPALIPEGVEVKSEPFIVKKGEVGFHHCMTWHGSPHNRSQQPRRAFAIHYMPGYTFYFPRKSHPVEKYIAVKPGEVLAGDHFPVVYQRANIAPW